MKGCKRSEFGMEGCLRCTIKYRAVKNGFVFSSSRRVGIPFGVLGEGRENPSLQPSYSLKGEPLSLHSRFEKMSCTLIKRDYKPPKVLVRDYKS